MESKQRNILGIDKVYKSTRNLYMRLNNIDNGHGEMRDHSNAAIFRSCFIFELV